MAEKEDDNVVPITKGKKKKGFTKIIADQQTKEQDRAEEIDNKLIEMNRRYAVYRGAVIDFQETFREGKLFITSKDLFANQLGEADVVFTHTPKGAETFMPIWKYWFNRHYEYRRTIEQIVFSNMKYESPLIWNMWEGFAFEPKRGVWGKYREHLLDIICEGDKESFEYLLNLFAWKLQNPTTAPGVCLVLVSDEEGTGKGLALTPMELAFGRASDASVTGETLFANNERLAGKAWVTVNEMSWSSKKDKDKFKAMITEPRVEYRGKWVKEFGMDNHTMYAITSNSEHVVQVADTSRRFFILRVSAERMGDVEYFKEILREMGIVTLGAENEKRSKPEYDPSIGTGCQAFLYDMLHRKLKGFNPRFAKIPRTSALIEQRVESLRGTAQWLRHCVSMGSFDLVLRDSNPLNQADAWPESISRFHFYNAYLTWHTKTKQVGSADPTQRFWKVIKKSDLFTFKMVKGARLVCPVEVSAARWHLAKTDGSEE